MKEILRLMQALSYAIEGLVYLFREEKNTRLLLIIMASTLIVCPLIGFTAFQTAIVFFAVTMVTVAEVINTSIEVTLDMICGGKYHPKVKIAKDIASFSVFLCIFNSLIIFLVIIVQNLIK